MYEHLPNYTRSSIQNARRLRSRMTDAERRIWSKLRNNQLGIKFRRQVPFGKYILDFYCAKVKVCVELDGSQHYSEKGKQKDKYRDSYLRGQGVEVLRVSNIEALKNTIGVMQTLFELIQERLHREIPSSPGKDT